MDDDMGFDFGFDYDEEADHAAAMAEIEARKITQHELLRWSSWVKPFPLPEYMVPESHQMFEDVDDDVLLNAPPHLLVHIQRTASQKGLQVVSPRQTPCTGLMGRAVDVDRSIGDHVVGSIAARSTYWPTLEEVNLDKWLPDEPMPAIDRDKVMRQKTRTEPLTRAAHLLKDPILACLIKGRAVIDILRRPDVAGDADAMTDLLAEAWGIPTNELMEMDAYSLGMEGQMLRHAIKADDVYPMVHGAIHRKLCVGVGNSEITRELLPEDSAMDWRRMRVVSEAIFLMSCSIEGIPLTEARCYPPPGDPTAPLNRPNILAFRPLPCTAWTFEAKSFSICPVYTPDQKRTREIPPEVLHAMSKYVAEVRPVTHAMAAGQKSVAKRSVMIDPEIAPDETLSSMYSILTSKVVTGGGRGKTAAATVRNVIFKTLEDAPLSLRLRIARYIHIATSEVKIHMNLTEVPDEMVHRLAIKFVAIGETLRAKIAAEATRRGSSVEEWWADIVAQVPARYAGMKEGTMGWAQVGMWLLFREPTEKWTRLEKAVHYSALRDAEVGSIGAIALPPERGSPERILQACSAAVSRITSTYAGYYIAVSDVGHTMADILHEQGKTRSSEILKEASYLWVMRARALRGTNIHLVGKDKPTPSQQHYRVEAPSTDVLVVPAPYRAFEAYKGHVARSKVMNKVAQKSICGYNSRIISPLFEDLAAPLVPCRDSLLTRYLIRPSGMATDMERAWQELRSDVEKVVRVFGCGIAETAVPRRKRIEEVIEIEYLEPPTKAIRSSGKSYYDLMAEMDADEVDWFEEMVMSMDVQTSEEMMNRTFTSMEQLRQIFLDIDKDMGTSEIAHVETVR